MSETVVPASVVRARAEAWPLACEAGATFELRLPATFFKETHATLVWSGEVQPGFRAFNKMYRHRNLLSALESKWRPGRAERGGLRQRAGSWQ